MAEYLQRGKKIERGRDKPKQSGNLSEWNRGKISKVDGDAQIEASLGYKKERGVWKQQAPYPVKFEEGILARNKQHEHVGYGNFQWNRTLRKKDVKLDSQC